MGQIKSEVKISDIEVNTFLAENVSKEWIESVENETGLVRDNDIYPKLNQWFDSRNDVVIDIGSGQGICSTKIDGYKEYIGIEPSEYLTKRAQELYVSSSRKFLQGNAYDLPIQSESCDSVFSINVWFHLSNIDQANKEISRVLKPDGRFLIITADSDALDIWKSFYIGSISDDNKLIGKMVLPINDKVSVNISSNTFFYHSNKEIIDSLESHNLKITKVSKIGKVKDQTIFIAVEGEKIIK